MLKLHLLKILIWKQVRNNNRLPILTLTLSGETKQWHKKYEKYQFWPKDVQRILSSHKILEKCNDLEVFYKKAVLKNLAIFTGKHLCWGLLFNKNAGRQVCIKENFCIKENCHNLRTSDDIDMKPGPVTKP